MELFFDNPGYSEDELNRLLQRGIRYEKREKKQLLEAKKTIRHANQQSLNAIEQEFKIKLPEDYAAFLMINNGGVPTLKKFKINSQDFSMVRYFFLTDCPYKKASLEANIKGFQGRSPEEFFPIAEDVGGNYILISHKGENIGSIFFWDHEFEADNEGQPYYKNIIKISNSINDFLNSLSQPSEDY